MKSSACTKKSFSVPLPSESASPFVTSLECLTFTVHSLRRLFSHSSSEGPKFFLSALCHRERGMTRIVPQSFCQKIEDTARDRRADRRTGSGQSIVLLRFHSGARKKPWFVKLRASASYFVSVARLCWAERDCRGGNRGSRGEHFNAWQYKYIFMSILLSRFHIDSSAR